MESVSLILCVVAIAMTAFCLVRKINPQTILIIGGIAMMALGIWLDINPVVPEQPTGNVAFDMMKIVEETFLSNLARAGFMIATIGGYVAFMNHIEATKALVYITVRPLSCFKKYPYVAAMLAIPIGQLLFITTPSASGLGLLLVASLAPILIELGVSKLTALSVIVAATIFDQGPGSANTAMAARIIGIDAIEYFIRYQLSIVLPTGAVAMLLFYLSNRYYDRKEKMSGNTGGTTACQGVERPSCPLYFALLPVLPLFVLVVFSPIVKILPFPININTTTAMLFSTFAALLLVAISKKSVKQAFMDTAAFWNGMGKVFAGVVTLIVASEIFAKGLISLGFIDSLISYSTGAGLSGRHVAAIFSGVVFSAATLMGSGNAAFFSFGPLLPDIAMCLDIPIETLVLPLQLSASMGRAISPIAAVIVAIAGFSGAKPMEIAKRNTLPMVGSLIFLIIANFVFL